MNGIVTIINHPGMPWSAGGVVGGIVGFVAGQPHCNEWVDGRLVQGCAAAMLPLLDKPADVATFSAAFTVVGAVIGFVVSKLDL